MSGWISAVAAAYLPASLSDALLALLVRVRVVLSRDISNFLFGAKPLVGCALSIELRRAPDRVGGRAFHLSNVNELWLIKCRG